jgi:capsular polysaccharide transport system permease protein
LLALGENLVNRLNERSRTDLVRYAENEVNEAKERAARSAIALSEYRNRRGIVDPEKQAEVQVQLISKLQDEMIATQTQLDELIRFAPENPQVPVYRQRIASIQRQIQQESGKVAGGQRSLAGTAPGYERVFLENEFAAKQLTGALAALQDAKNEARRQQIYVERIVQPSRPDKAVEPKRLKGIASTLLLGLLFYGIARLLFAGIKEHQP